MSEELHDVRLGVNGVPRELRVPARRLLSDALRHDLGLTGTHVGCEHGVCGACTVLVDGRPARSCLILAVSAVGCEITTVEALTEDDGSPEGRLGPVPRWSRPSRSACARSTRSSARSARRSGTGCRPTRTNSRSRCRTPPTSTA